MDTIRELSNVDVYMKKPRFLCPATMKLTIFFGTINQLQTAWLMWELLSHKDSIVRMEITPLSNLYPNMRCWKSPFGPFNNQIHLKKCLSLPHFIPFLLASISSPSSLSSSPYPSFILGLFGPPSILLPPSLPLSFPSFTIFEAFHHLVAGLLFSVYSHLLLSPPLSPSYAAWPPCCLLHLSKAEELKALQFRDTLISPSHAQDPFTFFSMASVGSDMIPHSLSILGPGLYDAL